MAEYAHRPTQSRSRRHVDSVLRRPRFRTEHCSFMTSDGTWSADGDVIRMLAGRGGVVSLTVDLAPGATQPAATASALAMRHCGLVDPIQRLRQVMATVVCGTDAGVGPAKPHDVLPYAISALVGIGGFEPVNALRPTMSTSAAALGVGRCKSRLAAGFDADILGTARSPLADIDALRTLAAVFTVVPAYAEPHASRAPAEDRPRRRSSPAGIACSTAGQGLRRHVGDAS